MCLLTYFLNEYNTKQFSISETNDEKIFVRKDTFFLDRRPQN